MKTFLVSIDGRERKVSVDDHGIVTVDGGGSCEVRSCTPTEYTVALNGRVARVAAHQDGAEGVKLITGGRTYAASVQSERALLMKKYARSTRPSASKMDIHAPMPALVVRVEVEVGQSVTPGQGLIILEAMKMENEIKAHFAGSVKSIHAQMGKPVEKGELLLVLE
jgi:pyruvate carboxylase subunit B